MSYIQVNKWDANISSLRHNDDLGQEKQLAVWKNPLNPAQHCLTSKKGDSLWYIGSHCQNISIIVYIRPLKETQLMDSSRFQVTFVSI